MCFNSSSASSKSSEVRDERVGADNGGTAFRSTGANAIITVGSDEVAQSAIESSTLALTASTDFVGEAFSQFLKLTDGRLARADQNIESNNARTADLIKNQAQTNDDRLIKLLQYGMIAGVVIVGLKSGIVTKGLRALK